MELGVEGMMISPGYSYQKAPDQAAFSEARAHAGIVFPYFGNPKKGWQFNQSPLFLDFLMGRREYECTPWGNPTYNVFGWQKPCYLLQEGYAKTFRELIDSTEWDHYGTGRNEKCADCMVHCGYEASAVERYVRHAVRVWSDRQADDAPYLAMIENVQRRSPPVVRRSRPAIFLLGVSRLTSARLTVPDDRYQES